MLIRLTPEQIVVLWEQFRPLLLENLIPKVEKTPETVFACLQALMMEKIQLWAGLEPGDNRPLEDRFIGCIATVIDIDPISKTKNLLLYSIFAIKPIPKEMWINGMKILEEYRDLNNCNLIMAFSNIPYIAELCKSLGFKSQEFLYKEK